MLKKVITAIICAICLSLVGCARSGKDWNSEIDILFSDVKAMHSQIIVELANPNREPGDYTAAAKIIAQNGAKIKARFNEIMAASRWEVGNDEKTALKEKMMEFPKAATDGIDTPYTGIALRYPATGKIPRSDQEIQEAKDRFYRTYSDLFSGGLETTEKDQATDSSFESKLKTKYSSVKFVDRNSIFSSAKPDPLMLIIEIGEDGELRLNASDAGTIADTAFLSQKIMAVFQERQKLSIAERGIVVDPKGNTKEEELERVVQTLADANAAPIQIVKIGQ